MATYWENSCSFGLRYVSWYKCLIVSLVFSHLGFWSGNLFLIAPFPDLRLLVPFNRAVTLLRILDCFRIYGVSATYVRRNSRINGVCATYVSVLWSMYDVLGVLGVFCGVPRVLAGEYTGIQMCWLCFRSSKFIDQLFLTVCPRLSCGALIFHIF